MKPTVAMAVAAAIAVLAGVALAAQIGVATTKVGANNAAVPHCDTAFTVSYTTSRGNVTAVTVGGIADPACEGGSMKVTLKNASGTSIASAGPQTVPTDGDTVDNSLTLTTSPQPSASQVTGIEIDVEGP